MTVLNVWPQPPQLAIRGRAGRGVRPVSQETVYTFPTPYMDVEEKPESCIDEAYKRNLRIRLHETTRDDGSISYGVEIAAWNAWAGQGKLLDLMMGLSKEEARWFFDAASEILAGYDWMAGEVVLEDKK